MLPLLLYFAKFRAGATKNGRGEGRGGERRKRLPANPTILEKAKLTARQDTDNDRLPDLETFTLFPKTRSTRLQNWNKKKLYNKTKHTWFD